MAKIGKITLGKFDPDAIRRAKGQERIAIAKASPAQRLAMQKKSLFGDDKSLFSFDISQAARGFL